MNRNIAAAVLAFGLTALPGCRTAAPEIKPATTPTTEAQPEIKNILAAPNLSKLLENITPEQLDKLLLVLPKPQP